jgi:hypothetical protein
MHANGRGWGRGYESARGAPRIRGVFGDAAQSALGYAGALEAAKAQMPAELRAFLPDVSVNEIAGYALDADSFLANPAVSATSIARSYLDGAVGPEISNLITEALTAVFTAAGAAFGTMIPVPIVGTVVGALAGKLVGVIVNDFTNHNVDRFLTPAGGLIPEVEDVIAAWARPEYASRGAPRSVSEDFHNMGLYEGKGPIFTVLGRMGIAGPRIAWQRGILDWAKTERLVPPDDAGKRFYDEIGRAMGLFHQRSAMEATAKAAVVQRALEIVRNPALGRFASGVNRAAFSVTQGNPYAAASQRLSPALLTAATEPSLGPGLGALVLNRNAFAATLPAPVIVAGGVGLAGALWWVLRRFVL